MKANVQSVVVSFIQNERVVVSFVQNERNTRYQIDVIHLLICDKDRIFLFFSFSPEIFCLFLHSPLFQALLIKLEHIFFIFLDESAAAVMSISFDFGAIIIFLFGLIF